MDSLTSLTTEERPDGLKVVRIHGDLDSMGTQLIQDAFSRAISDRTDTVIVDLSDVKFLSSSGMAMLLVKGKMLRQGGGNLILAGPSERVLDVLRLSGFHELFEIYPSVEEALAALEKRQGKK
ncbi:MAG TPA: anti-sigma factor antagonist [Chloroflexi bacterium]|nr:anti-sigma factor antagonist [Chloroflexota bacterium]